MIAKHRAFLTMVFARSGGTIAATPSQAATREILLGDGPEIKTLFGNGYVAHENTVKNEPKMLVGFGRALAQATPICQGAPQGASSGLQVSPTIKLREGSDAEILSRSVMVLQAIPKSQLPGADGKPEIWIVRGEFLEEPVQETPRRGRAAEQQDRSLNQLCERTCR